MERPVWGSCDMMISRICPNGANTFRTSSCTRVCMCMYVYVYIMCVCFVQYHATRVVSLKSTQPQNPPVRHPSSNPNTHTYILQVVVEAPDVDAARRVLGSHCPPGVARGAAGWPACLWADGGGGIGGGGGGDGGGDGVERAGGHDGGAEFLYWFVKCG